MVLDSISPAARETFERALALHRSGNLQAAEAQYRELVHSDPHQFDFQHLLGICFMQQGRLSDAKVYLETAVDLNPTSAIAHYNLAFTLSELHLVSDALDRLNHAIAIQSDYFEAYMLRADLLSRLKRLEEALNDCDVALGIRSDAAGAFLNRGTILKDLKRYEESILSYDKAIELDPHYAAAFVNRANAKVKLGRHDEALKDYHFAIRLRPNFVEAYSNLAHTHKELGQHDAAIQCCQKAIGLRPDSLSFLILGQIDADEGRFEQAEAHYLKAHSLDPKLAAPLYFLSEVKKFNREEPLISVINDLSHDESLSQDDRSKLFHAYGKIMNDLSRYDEAIDSFKSGKALKSIVFQFDKIVEKYDLIRSVFSRKLISQHSRAGLRDQRPVFIVGMPRSGTTLIDQILSSHGSVYSLGERNDMHAIFDLLCSKSTNAAEIFSSISHMSNSDLEKIAGLYLNKYDAVPHGKTRIIDKLPHNFEMIGLIHFLFPESRIIHCRRDAMDNCVSLFMHNFNDSHSYHNDLYSLGRYYREYERLVAYWRDIVREKMIDISYEDTVLDLEKTARTLVAFLGLDWDPSCLDFHRHEREVRTASVWQVRQPIYTNSIGRWRRYESHLEPLKKGLQLLDTN